MAIQIAGINSEEVSVGIIFDSNVSFVLGQNQSWTVPAGKYFEGQVSTTVNGGRATISGATVFVPNDANSNLGISAGKIILGENGTIQAPSGITLRVSGALFTNG